MPTVRAIVRELGGAGTTGSRRSSTASSTSAAFQMRHVAAAGRQARGPAPVARLGNASKDRQGACHVHHEEGALPPDDAAGTGRDDGAAAPRRDGAGADASAQTAANPVRRFGAVFVPLGERPGLLGAGDDRAPSFELSPDPEAAREAPEHMTVVSQLCDPLDGHATTVAAWLSGVIPKRTLAEDVHAGVTVDQVDRRADRQDTADAVAGAGDRGLHRLDRRLRPVLQLRLHEHHLVEERHHADADGDQPARRCSSACSGGPARARSAWRGWPPTAASSTRWSRSSSGLQPGLGGRDPNRLNDYLENVREIEQRIQKAEKQSATQRRGARRAGRHPRGVRGPRRR